MSPGTPRVARHRWDKHDRCINCGATREGYGGGRTGMLLYRPVNGNPSYQAGECKPRGASR